MRAGIAQLVEHLICNQGVTGSNPVSGTIPPQPRHCGNDCKTIIVALPGLIQDHMQYQIAS